MSGPEPPAPPRSAALFERARALFPGGVNSPVRAYRAVGGTPLFVRRASGCAFEDEDGRRYVDCCLSWGPLLLGHAHPAVVAAVEESAREGTSFGAPSRREIALAERALRLAGRSGADGRPAWKMRLVSTGTEAVMTAVRLARAETGRDRIVTFEGGYHGHADAVLVKAGSGLATAGRAASAGVPEAVARLTTVLPFDDEEAVETLFRREGGSIAAVLVEPVPANAGLLVQRPGFLEGLRRLTRAHGALLVFDEVITGFRLGGGGASTALGIEPDLVTWGKVLGGGMPVGAVAGPAARLDRLAPEGDVYQAGTLSGNPVAMAAGEATLREIEDAPEDPYARLEALGADLARGLEEVLRRRGVEGSLARAGSIFWLSFQDPAPRAKGSIRAGAAALYASLFHGLLRRGVYWAPSAFEVGFLSTAHDAGAVAAIVEAFDGAIAELPAAGALRG